MSQSPQVAPAGMLDGLTFPGFRTRFAGQRRGPEAPALFSGRGFESRDETARARVSARDPRDHQTAGEQRGGCGAVVLARVYHLDLPRHCAVEAIEREKARIVRHHEDGIAFNCDATIDSARRIGNFRFRISRGGAP
jgi:hypothetical protein